MFMYHKTKVDITIQILQIGSHEKCSYTRTVPVPVYYTR